MSQCGDGLSIRRVVQPRRLVFRTGHGLPKIAGQGNTGKTARMAQQCANSRLPSRAARTALLAPGPGCSSTASRRKHQGESRIFVPDQFRLRSQIQSLGRTGHSRKTNRRGRGTHHQRHQQHSDGSRQFCQRGVTPRPFPGSLQSRSWFGRDRFSVQKPTQFRSNVARRTICRRDGCFSRHL